MRLKKKKKCSASTDLGSPSMVPALTASDVASGPNCIPSPRDSPVHSTATPVPECKEKIVALDPLRAITDKDVPPLSLVVSANDPSSPNTLPAGNIHSHCAVSAPANAVCIPSPRDNPVHSTATSVPERREKTFAFDLLRAITDKDSTSLDSLLNDPLVTPQIDPSVIDPPSAPAQQQHLERFFAPPARAALPQRIPAPKHHVPLAVPKSSNLTCKLCDSKCHSEAELADHLYGRPHARALRIARKAIMAYSEYLALGMLSKTRPRFLAEIAPLTLSDFFDQPLDLSAPDLELMQTHIDLRNSLDAHADKSHWRKFIAAVAKGSASLLELEEGWDVCEDFNPSFATQQDYSHEFNFTGPEDYDYSDIWLP